MNNPFRAPWLVTAAQVFAKAGAPLYAVGGVVRNTLMGLPASDIDVCGPAKPEQVAAFCAGTPVRAELRAAHFGTVELHVQDADGRHMAEYTTFRVDSYRCGHRPSAVHFADSPEVDALRRDFSVNALYLPLNGNPESPAPVLDPTGGLVHLRQGILHTVTPDPDHVFQDDGLRILRAARFQAELGLAPTAALLASARRFAPLLSEIASERLREEITRLLLADTKYPTLPRVRPPVPDGLQTLLATGAWPYVFGSLRPHMPSIEAQAYYQPPEGLPPVSGKLALLFALESADALALQMQKLRFSVREVTSAQQALHWTNRLWKEQPATIDALNAGQTAVFHAVAAFSALSAAGFPCKEPAMRAQEMALLFQNDHLPKSLKELAINGNDLKPLLRRFSLPDASLGRALHALWEATAEESVPNEREALLQSAAEWMKNETQD